MGRLTEEVQLWRTPLVGSYLLWHFTSGYCDAHPSGDAPVALLHFLAMPLLENQRLLRGVNNRRADLQSYVRSFDQEKDSDVLITIHDRVRRTRGYTMAAIDVALSTGLMRMDSDSAKLYPCNATKKAGRGHKPRAALHRDGKRAAILGRWFAQHSVTTIATYLKVVL